MRTVTVLLAAVLFVGLADSAHAQRAWKNQVALTGGAQIPMNAFADDFSTGAGFDGTYYYRTSQHFFFGVRSGYHRFEQSTGSGTFGVIPLHLASKYNFSLTGLQPYVGLDGGLYLLRPESGDNPAEPGLAPQFGFRIPIASGIDIDLNVTYEVIFQDPENTTYIGANAGLAYIFGR